MRLYLRTDYVIDGGVHVAIGRRSGELDRTLAAMGARSGVLITAANPRSRAMTDGWNRRMTVRLVERLARLPVCPAEGRFGAWREEGLLACGDPRRMVVIGRTFRQNALVLLQRGRTARLLTLV